MSLARLARSTFLTFSLATALAAAGCGGGDDDGDATADASPQPTVDAAPGQVDAAAPDAGEACTGENEAVCLGACVDTSTSTLHCGGCNMACNSPGQICSGALPCACPDPFIDATVASGLGSVTDMLFPGMTMALDPIIDGGVVNVLGVGYIPGTTPIGIDIPLNVENSPAIVAAAYDVDLTVDPPTFHVAYLASAGTINYTTACDVGASGTITGLTLAEINQFDATFYEGGCEFDVATVSFTIGDPCPPPA